MLDGDWETVGHAIPCWLTFSQRENISVNRSTERVVSPRSWVN